VRGRESDSGSSPSRSRGKGRSRQVGPTRQRAKWEREEETCRAGKVGWGRVAGPHGEGKRGKVARGLGCVGRERGSEPGQLGCAGGRGKAGLG
jgi:hypothetical protein